MTVSSTISDNKMSTEIARMILLLELCASILIYMDTPRGLDPVFLCTVAVLGICTFAGTVLHLQLSDRRVVGAFGLFGLSICIVHFQSPLLSPFIEEVRINNRNWFYTPLTGKAVAIAYAAVTALCLGYLATGSSRTVIRTPPRLPQSLCARLRLITHGLSIAALALYALFYSWAGERYRNGYYAFYEYDVPFAPHALLLFSIVLLSAISLDIYRVRSECGRLSPLAAVLRLNKTLLAVSSLFVLISLYVGDRGPVIQVLLAYICGYTLLLGRIPAAVTWGGLFVGAVIMSLIANFRITAARSENIDLGNRLDKATDVMQTYRWYEITENLTGSNSALVAAVFIVERDHTRGGSLLLETLMSLVPFRSESRFSASPTLEHGGGSSGLVTDLILGETSSAGMGTTAIGDIYLDFGLPGVVLGFLGLGFFIRKIELLAENVYSYPVITLYLILASLSIYWARSNFFGGNAKILVWGFIFAEVVSVVAVNKIVGSVPVLGEHATGTRLGD